MILKKPYKSPIYYNIIRSRAPTHTHQGSHIWRWGIWWWWLGTDLGFDNVVVHVRSEALDELHVVDGLRRVIGSLLPYHSDLADYITRRLLNELKDDVIDFKLLHHVTFEPSERYRHILIVILSPLLEHLLFPIFIDIQLYIHMFMF